MFLYPTKGEESDVISGLVISGIITAEAAGTSGKQYSTNAYVLNKNICLQKPVTLKDCC